MTIAKQHPAPITGRPDYLAERARDLLAAARHGDPGAVSTLNASSGPAREFRLSDALHAVAGDAGFSGWAAGRMAADDGAMDREDRIDRLRIALVHGQHWVVRRLIDDDPEIANADLAIELALYDEASIASRLRDDPESATRKIGGKPPIMHLAMSRHIHAAPEKHADMLNIASALLRSGADVNDGIPAEPDSPHMLSALYAALCHADNFDLGRWLLHQGADPDDDESLYHSTELEHADATRLLLKHGARVDGTNALLRAIDFNDHLTVRLLIGHGASVDAQPRDHPGGEPSLMVPAMHHAARRMCDADMARLLLEAEADVTLLHHGHSPFAYSRIYGNRAIAEVIEDGGGDTGLDPTESVLAALADDTSPHGMQMADIEPTPEIGGLLANLAPWPGRLDHLKRLVGFGFDPNATDEMGMTPLHVAGWEGLPDTMGWLLSLSPSLDHVNGFGGDLLSTIIHGSENCPQRRARDHIACARLALEAGVPLGVRAIRFAGNRDMAEFLLRWSVDFPEQVVEGGIA